MRTLALLALLAPLVCHGGSVLGGDITTSTIASNQAKKINTPPPPAPAQHVIPHARTDRERIEGRRRAEQAFDDARREIDRRRLLEIPGP